MMRASVTWPALAVAVLLLPAGAQAQTCTMRGRVVDTQGQPLPGVKVELEFKGESRVKVVKLVETDKKGSYIRSGMASGPWHMRFSKDGYEPVETVTDVTGGISDLPLVTMRAAAPAAPVPGLEPDAGGEAALPALRASYTQALAALKEGRDAEAETLLKQVLDQAPETGPAWFWLGQVYLARPDLPAAEAALRKALALQPEDSKTHVALATALEAAGRNGEALALMQEAAPRFASDADFQFTLGVTAMNAGRESEAQPAFAKTLELNPEHAEAHYYVGTLAIGANDVAGAVAHLEKYLTLAPPTSPNLPVAKKLVETLEARK